MKEGSTGAPPAETPEGTLLEGLLPTEEAEAMPDSELATWRGAEKSE